MPVILIFMIVVFAGCYEDISQPIGAKMIAVGDPVIWEDAFSEVRAGQKATEVENSFGKPLQIQIQRDGSEIWEYRVGRGKHPASIEPPLSPDALKFETCKGQILLREKQVVRTSVSECKQWP